MLCYHKRTTLRILGPRRLVSLSFTSVPELEDRPAVANSPQSLSRTVRFRWLPFLVLGGYLLFAHGCHADKDTELLGTGYIRLAMTESHER
jgi:hypothetical protein